MSAETSKQITVIQPQTGWALPDLGELWRYRGVISNFVARNFKVSYRQTIGGPIYAIYQPFMAMVGYSVLLGGLAQMPSEGIPYPIFTYSALIIWTLFTTSVTDASISLQANSALVQKIYMPRLVFPIIAVAMALLNFGIAFLVLLVMMPIYGVMPTVNVLFLPLFVLLALTLALGVGLCFSGMHARFRDTSYAVGLITRGVFFLTPVVYSSSLLPAPWNELYKFNPMAVVVEGFRWSLLGVGTAPGAAQVAFAVGFTLVVLLVGALYFKRLEATIADVV